jgi:hypothetical protein
MYGLLEHRIWAPADDFWVNSLVDGESSRFQDGRRYGEPQDILTSAPFRPFIRVCVFHPNSEGPLRFYRWMAF